MKEMLKDKWTILLISMIFLVAYLGGLQDADDMEGKTCPFNEEKIISWGSIWLLNEKTPTTYNTFLLLIIIPII